MQPVRLHFEIDGDDFTIAGEASSEMKKALRKMNITPEAIRKAAICMYEGEINMVIHANGGTIDVAVAPDSITMMMRDTGPGIADIALAMKEGYSTAGDVVRDLGFGAGMGLPNIKRYSDEMDVQSTVGEGTVVTVRIALPQSDGRTQE